MISWEIFYVLGAVALALGVTYGLVKYYTRDRSNDAISEASAKAQYDNPRVADASRASDALRRQVRKS